MAGPFYTGYHADLDDDFAAECTMGRTAEFWRLSLGGNLDIHLRAKHALEVWGALLPALDLTATKRAAVESVRDRLQAAKALETRT